MTHAYLRTVQCNLSTFQECQLSTGSVNPNYVSWSAVRWFRKINVMQCLIHAELKLAVIIVKTVYFMNMETVYHTRLPIF